MTVISMSRSEIDRMTDRIGISEAATLMGLGVVRCSDWRGHFGSVAPLR
jgi:hypothetical protein